MTCRSCGGPLPDHAAFCPLCGDRISLADQLGLTEDTRNQFSPAATRQVTERRSFAVPLVLAALLLAGSAGFALVMSARGGGGSSVDEPASASNTSVMSSAPASEATPTSPEPTPRRSSVPATPSASPSVSTPIPAGARKCSTSGDGAAATAYAGNDRTSCQFADAVRTAYLDAPSGGTMQVPSPVTGQTYQVTCDGGPPVRCTTTTGAIVLLAPRG